MPEPVSCHPAQNDPSIIECDPVCIGPEADAPPPVESRSRDPGVRALVARHEPPLTVRRQETVRIPDVFDAGEIASKCAGKAAGAVLGVVGAARLHPALAVLTALKVGFDLEQCVLETVHDATERAVTARSLELCTNEGGTTLGTVNGVLTCEIPPEEEP